MAGFVDLEKIAIRSDRALSRLDRGQVQELERYLSTALRRTLDQTQPLYARAMTDVRGTEANAAFRLARGRVLADEIDGTIRGLVGQPDGALEGLLARAASAREQGREFVEEALGVFGDAVTISTPINHRALSGVVEHASTRLYLHADEVVDRIREDVVTGLVRGDSWAQVTRSIREDTGYLRSRAERIAITELHSAQADAREELYAELGVELVIRYVTIDDRTCEYCAPRQGEVTKTGETTEVLHPYCRCILAPFDPEWALDDTLVTEQLEEMLSDNLEQLEELGIEPKYGPAPFERKRIREGVRTGPAGRGRPSPVWRPGQPTSKLTPWLGRSFTNLAPRVRPPGGGPSPAPTTSTPPTDPVEQARVLPKKARDQLRQIDGETEAKALRERVTAAERAQANLARATGEVDGRLEQLQTQLTARSAERRRVDERILNAREHILDTRPDLRRLNMVERQTAIEQLTRELVDEGRRLEGEIRALRATAESLSTQRRQIRDQYLAASSTRREAQRAVDDYRRARGHELLANRTTGHANGSVPTSPRMRDADLKARVETAQEWLAGHTTFKIDRPTDVRRLRKGARAYHQGGTVHLAPSDGAKVAVHELGHAIDRAHPSLVQRAIAYRESRTVGEQARRLRDVTGVRAYKLDEIAKCDRFIDCYMGKIYGHRSTEILSMGLEYMYDDPIGFAQKDPTTFDFIFRIMKGLPDP